MAMLCKKVERLILSNGIFNGYSGEGSEAAGLGVAPLLTFCSDYWSL